MKQRDLIIFLSGVPIWASATPSTPNQLHVTRDPFYFLSQVFPIAKELAGCVVPAEYGISAAHKLRIGKKIAAELIGKLLVDLENSRADCDAAAYDATASGEATSSTIASALHNTLPPAGAEPGVHSMLTQLTDRNLMGHVADEAGPDEVSSEVCACVLLAVLIRGSVAVSLRMIECKVSANYCS